MHPPAELPPFNRVGSATCHLLSPCHCYHFKESFQRQFAHFLQTDLFFLRSPQTSALTRCHASGFFPLVSLSLSSSLPEPPGLSIIFKCSPGLLPEKRCAHYLACGPIRTGFEQDIKQLLIWDVELSLSDCKISITPDLLLPGGTINARGPNSASGCAAGGGVSHCRCKGGNVPCLALRWVKR